MKFIRVILSGREYYEAYEPTLDAIPTYHSYNLPVDRLTFRLLFNLSLYCVSYFPSSKIIAKL
jgi:hypothetical protein